MPNSNTQAPLDVPEVAHHPSDDEFAIPDHLDVDAKETPATVSSIEQLFRVVLVEGGAKRYNRFADKAIDYQKSHERKHVFSIKSGGTVQAENSNDPWLRNELQKARTNSGVPAAKEQEIYGNRWEWYDNLVLPKLETAVKNALDLLDEDPAPFVAIEITHQPTGDMRHSYSPEDLKGEGIAKFGYSPPLHTYGCQSQSSDSVYAFLPWCGVVVCTCPFKHENPLTTLCKHEVAALIKRKAGNFAAEPQEIDVHPRCSRFVSLEAYSRYNHHVKDSE